MATAREVPERASPGTLNARAILLVFVSLTTIAIIAQTVWTIVQDRHLTIATDQENGLIAVRLLEEHAQQQLAVAANRLDIVFNGIRALNRQTPVNEDRVHEVIEESLKNNRSAGALQFVTPDGERWVSAFDFPSYVFNTEPRDYIAWMLEHPTHRSVFMGTPFQRAIDAEMVLPLARNMYDPPRVTIDVASLEPRTRGRR